MYVSNPKQRPRPRRIEPSLDYDPLSLLEEFKTLAKQPSRPHQINSLRRAVAKQANAPLKAQTACMWLRHTIPATDSPLQGQPRAVVS